MRYCHWLKEPGARVEGSRQLDASKVQAPCIVRNPAGGFRLYYTAVGPGKPYPDCQGYILSAISDDGLNFQAESGIRLSPQPEVPQRSLRLLAPTVYRMEDSAWRMYMESRGPATIPTVIASAVSSDQVHWEFEDGVRLQCDRRLGGPRFLQLPDGRGRLYCFKSANSKGVVSAITSDGLNFALEPGCRLAAGESEFDSSGITAAEVIASSATGDPWTMVYSAWQDVPPGTEIPLHPSQDVNAVERGQSADFAAASIATDMAGYRSRIFIATSPDGLTWEKGACIIEGAGHGTDGLDAVHAEDMSVIKLDDGRFRMYYAACDKDGVWRIASAVTK